jgi:SAM-dependent methyltransferase
LMTTFKDHFSKQASAYARHRPHYPPELFEYLASIAPRHDLAWDCGTGNGQAALGLTPYFDRVIATDPSEEQLRNAFQNEKIIYRQAPAEDPGIEPRSVDLVTVAQALHWFDIDRFFEQVKRVLVPEGVIAVWCYSLCRISPQLDPIVDRFYFETVGPYWPEERKLVDDMYRAIPFPFDEIQPPAFSIELGWTLDDMLGYLRTWSPTRLFIERNGLDPVSLIEGELGSAWGDLEQERAVIWPVHMRVGTLSAQAV